MVEREDLEIIRLKTLRNPVIQVPANVPIIDVGLGRIHPDNRDAAKGMA